MATPGVFENVPDRPSTGETLSRDWPGDQRESTRNPYRRTYSWGQGISDFLMAVGDTALPGAGALDYATGSNVRNRLDRATGGYRSRNQNADSSYMRDMIRNDPGYKGSSFSQWLSGLFNRDKPASSPGDDEGAPSSSRLQELLRGLSNNGGSFIAPQRGPGELSGAAAALRDHYGRNPMRNDPGFGQVGSMSDSVLAEGQARLREAQREYQARRAITPQ